MAFASQRPSSTSPSLTFDGTGNARTLFFQFERTIAAKQSDTQRAETLLNHLQGDAVEFYCERFCDDGDDDYIENEDAKSYRTIKKVFLQHFAQPRETLGSHFTRAMDFKYEGGSLEQFLCSADLLYAKAKLTDDHKFEQLQRALAGSSFPLTQILAAQPTSYAHLQKLLMTAARYQRAYGTVSPSHQVATSHANPGHQTTNTGTWNAEQGVAPTSYDTLKDEWDQRFKRFEEQVQKVDDDLSQQLERLTLAIGTPRNTKRCSHCGKEGVSSIECPDNPHREKRCRYCERQGHIETDCFKKLRDQRQPGAPRTGTMSAGPTSTPAGPAPAKAKTMKAVVSFLEAVKRAQHSQPLAQQRKPPQK